MSAGLYLLLKFAVGSGVFIVTCPLAFLLAAAFLQLLPENGQGLALFLAGIPFLFGSLVLTHLITEKLSRRWSH